MPEVRICEINIGMSGCGYSELTVMLDDEKSWGAASRLGVDGQCPIKIIAISHGILKDYAKMYYTAATQPKDYVEITGADHLFEESDHTTFQLFEET